MIDKIACFGLEKAINTALAMDPDTKPALQELAGKAIALHITDWNINMYCRYHDDGVQMSSTAPATVDTHINGKLFGLMKVGLAKGDSTALFEQKIEIEGDTATGEKARALFQNLDIDWEEHLSRITGDSIAHHLGKGAKRFGDWLKQTRTATCQSTTEYLQYETQALPCREEVEDFYKGVQTCRDDIERIAARIDLLTQGDNA
ncbi:MAG: SCP2 sterol-binding domain-containing protein [Coxiellaceae bacterium]|nr:SCP2 sterol-binding domain-containing protein [Coxiellaceae bacterium]